MNEVCTALADALRKAGEKYDNRFSLIQGAFRVVHDPTLCLFWLDQLDERNNFTLDHMDAVAAALGMVFEVRKDDGDWLYSIQNQQTAIWVDEGGMFSSKREASLAALLAIITHALEDGK